MPEIATEPATGTPGPGPRTGPGGAARPRWADHVTLLVPGLLLFAVSNGRWVVPIAAWVAPAVLLRWTRRRPAGRGFVVLAVLLAAVNSVAWSGTASPSWLPAALGPAVALVFLVDRVLAPAVEARTGSVLLATLPFPLAYTALDAGMAWLSPLGSIGAVGYTQAGSLPLVQLAAVTGVWGLTFLVTWFAPVANALLDHAGRRDAWRAAATYAVVVGLVLGVGGLRLVLAPPAGASMRIAGVTLVDRPLAADLWADLDADPAAFESQNRAIRERAVLATRREAAAGAQLVLFSEASIQGHARDADELVAWAARLARESGVTLVLPLYLVADAPGGLDVNALVVLDPKGDVVLRHQKYGAAALEDIEPGSGLLSFLDLPAGRVGAVICRDLDFPATVRQAGQARADLVVAPSFDWREIDPFHTEYAVFRGVENGFSLFRQTADGLSIATDPYGRVVAAMDHFAVEERVLVAQVPMAGQRTPYASFGDWFAWLSISGLAALAAVSASARRPARARRGGSG